MKYRKKPVVIEAIQFDGSNDSANEVLAWIGHYGHEARNTNGGVVIKTLEGDHLARPGDFIIKGVKNEFYPCRDDIFRQTYEVVDES